MSRSTRPCELMRGNARTFSEHVIGTIIYDSRCELSDVANRSASPIGGPSCLQQVLVLDLLHSSYRNAGKQQL